VPILRARATAGRLSMLSNQRFKLGYGARPSSPSTTGALSIQPQADTSAEVLELYPACGAK